MGVKGARVQNIIRELRGEKIDIVEWNEDVRSFAINALNPAKVSRVSIVDEKEKVMEVIVEDKQLSLAIGKRGQNVRLAARLLGWRIDIKSEGEKKLEVESQMDAAMAPSTEAVTDIHVLEGIGEKTMEKLVAHGLTSVESVVERPETVTEIPGVGEKTAEKLVTQARAYLDGGVSDESDTPNAASSKEGEQVLAMSVAESTSGVVEPESAAQDGGDENPGGES